MTKKELLKQLELFDDNDEIVFQEWSEPPIPITVISAGNIYSSGVDRPLIIMSPENIMHPL